MLGRQDLDRVWFKCNGRRHGSESTCVDDDASEEFLMSKVDAVEIPDGDDTLLQQRFEFGLIADDTHGGTHLTSIRKPSCASLT